MRLLVTAFILWFYVFSGVYRIAGIPIYPSMFLCLLGIFFYSRDLFLYLRSLLCFFFGFLFLVFLSQFLSNSDGVMFVTLLRYFFKSLVIPLGGAFFLCRLLQACQVKNFSTIIFFVFVFQFLLVVMQMSLPSFRSFFSSIVQLADNWKELADVGHFRATGLAGLSIYDTSVSYGLLLLVMCGFRRRPSFLFPIGVLLALVLTLIAGRTGLMFSLIVVATLFVYSKRKPFVLICCFLVGGGAVSVASLVVGWDSLYLFSRFAFEPIYAFYETGSFTSASTSHLVDDYLFVPWNINPILGDGYWAQPSLARKYGLEYQTDSGFLLFFIAFGFLGVVFCLLQFIWFSCLVFNILRDWVGFSFGVMACYAAMVLVFFLLLVKAPFFISERITPVVLVMLIMRFLYKKERGCTIM